MPYSVNWITKLITVPIEDMIPLGGNDYELSADSFWRQIRNLEWRLDQGLWALPILEHGDAETLGGTTFAPKNKIINGYSILLDGPSPTAEKVFLRGDNNNIVDVISFNGVSVIPSNSAGNTVTEVSTGSGLSDSERLMILEVWKRLDLDVSSPNRHHIDSSQITNGIDIDLVSTDNGDGTFTVQRL